MRLLRDTHIPSSIAQLRQPSSPAMGMQSTPQISPPPAVPPNHAIPPRPMTQMPVMSYPANMSQMQNTSRPPIQLMAPSQPPPQAQSMMMRQYPPTSQGPYNSRYSTFSLLSFGVSAFSSHLLPSVPNSSESYGFSPAPVSGRNVEPIANPPYGEYSGRTGSQPINQPYVAGFP